MTALATQEKCAGADAGDCLATIGVATCWSYLTASIACEHQSSYPREGAAA